VRASLDVGERAVRTPERRCPRCRSTAVLRILYGLPDEELRREAEEGKVALGGCCLSENDPAWICNDCEWTWGKRRGLGA
jgi:hypothetical protein